MDKEMNERQMYYTIHRYDLPYITDRSRDMNKEKIQKAPILSDEQIKDALLECAEVYYDANTEQNAGHNFVASSQRDADHKYWLSLFPEVDEKGLLTDESMQKIGDQMLSDGEVFREIANAQYQADQLEIADLKESHRKEIEETIRVYDIYIKLLIEEIESMITLAHSHGWESTRFEAGEKCRDNIKSLKDKYLDKAGNK